MFKLFKKKKNIKNFPRSLRSLGLYKINSFKLIRQATKFLSFYFASAKVVPFWWFYCANFYHEN